jgi:hypothetical protein
VPTPAETAPAGILEDEERFLENYTSLIQRGIFYQIAAKRDET